MREELREFIDHRTKKGKFSTPSECVRQLIREDQKREGERRLESLLLKARDSGEFDVDYDLVWEVVTEKIPTLRREIRGILQTSSQGS